MPAVGVDGAKSLQLAAGVDRFQRLDQQEAGDGGYGASKADDRAHGIVPLVEED